jgi:hypothetical protein
VKEEQVKSEGRGDSERRKRGEGGLKGEERRGKKHNFMVINSHFLRFLCLTIAY